MRWTELMQLTMTACAVVPVLCAWCRPSVAFSRHYDAHRTNLFDSKKVSTCNVSYVVDGKTNLINQNA